VAWENGYLLYPTPDERTRRVDPDIGEDESLLQWIAALHGVDERAIVEMTLRSYIGVVVAELKPRSQPRWWLRSRYGQTPPSYGPMFCPLCLGCDRVPYFRLVWRFGFITTCSTHHTRLVDQCPYCFCAPWPSGVGVKSKIHHNFKSLDYCWHCGESLSEATTEEPGSAQSSFDQSQLDSGFDEVFGSYAHLGAVRAICQLFLRNRPRERIEQSGGYWAELADSLSADAKATQAVEQLNITDRHLLIPQIVNMVKNWPAAFLEFTSTTGISKTHFNGAEGLQPIWMSDVVNASLARQNRSVTPAILEKTLLELRETLGRIPTQSEIRRRLNWQGEKGLEELFVNYTSKKDRNSVEVTFPTYT